MKNGFIKCITAAPKTVVGAVNTNVAAVKKAMADAEKAGANLTVFPELCLTGVSCGELFKSETLLNAAKNGLAELAEFSADKYSVFIVGLPVLLEQNVYNCAAVIASGEILGLVPKTNITSNFSQNKYFASAANLNNEYHSVTVGNTLVPVCANLIFRSMETENFRFGIEIGEDACAAGTPAGNLAKTGAAIIVNPAASTELVGAAEKRRILANAESLRLVCGYVLANMGEETGANVVFSGHSIIAENGKILAETTPFKYTLCQSEIDVDKIAFERQNTDFATGRPEGYTDILFNMEPKTTTLTRQISTAPFLPDDNNACRAETILSIQANGLKNRIEHTASKCAVVGISGGLDSCLALLAAVNAMDLLGRPHSDVLAVTMPCFGTTARTRNNAEIICKELGVTFKTVDIKEAVTLHFKNIGHKETCLDSVYENAQARERTQVLMDMANGLGGIVVGTGDLSESALGFATYNGDHMSMYSVNCSVPKTLVKYLIAYVANKSGEVLKNALLDVVNTPVSPELLPSDTSGNIAQKTEDLVGPYELHDFFLYYFVRFGFGPQKIYRLAKYAFGKKYKAAEIKKWLYVFFKKFFAAQFKRSCSPDGIRTGSVCLMPDFWHMPADTSAEIFLKETENL